MAREADMIAQAVGLIASNLIEIVALELTGRWVNNHRNPHDG